MNHFTIQWIGVPTEPQRPMPSGPAFSEASRSLEEASLGVLPGEKELLDAWDLWGIARSTFGDWAREGCRGSRLVVLVGFSRRLCWYPLWRIDWIDMVQEDFDICGPWILTSLACERHIGHVTHILSLMGLIEGKEMQQVCQHEQYHAIPKY